MSSIINPLVLKCSSPILIITVVSWPFASGDTVAKKCLIIKSYIFFSFGFKFSLLEYLTGCIGGWALSSPFPAFGLLYLLSCSFNNLSQYWP